MVVFTCNNCGESLQKPKVAKHYQFQCRTSENLTCVDCHKDFYGQEYVAHTKCITESERYGGQDYVARPGQNKGEKKQQAWINVVQNVIKTAKNLSKEERNVLNILSKHENIPRKKAKFMNFIRSVMSNRFNVAVIDSVWNKMETAFKDATEANTPVKENKNGVAKEEEKSINETSLKENQENNIAENQNNENICKENGNTVENGATVEDDPSGKKKKSKKRDLTDATTNSVDEPPTKKNKKKSDKETVEIELTPAPEDDENINKKFDWKTAILEIVGSHDEITMKKLRKKVSKRYVDHCSNSVTFEKACSRFDKKLGKITEVTIDENKVRLS